MRTRVFIIAVLAACFSGESAIAQQQSWKASDDTPRSLRARFKLPAACELYAEGSGKMCAWSRGADLIMRVTVDDHAVPPERLYRGRRGFDELYAKHGGASLTVYLIGKAEAENDMRFGMVLNQPPVNRFLEEDELPAGADACLIRRRSGHLEAMRDTAGRAHVIDCIRWIQAKDLVQLLNIELFALGAPAGGDFDRTAARILDSISFPD